MAERISAVRRVELQNVAEAEILRYKGDHARWHKHIHNVELDAAQVLKMIEMDERPNTIDFSCRRTGKTAVKELWQLEFNACNADQEEGIVAPREAQSVVALNYHLDAIRRSEILTAFIGNKSGRRQMADTYYQFANRSRAQAYGIMANVDGGDLTVASLEEVDDMPKDRLYSRFLLMLGSTRRLGAAKDSKNSPIIRITGVYKGADTLAEMVASGKYHVLPTVDAYLGIELGIINEQFVTLMREQLAPDEYIRQMLCRNVSAKNLIWEKWVRRALHVGLQAGLQIAEPMPGLMYKKRGLISFGYDHSGHGESPESSKYAFVVVELIGNFITFPFVKTWPPGTDEAVVKRDLLGYWAYFRPDLGMGDAYGIGMLTTLNDELYANGLTHLDRRTIGDGESTASTWSEWPFAPIRFEGMTKHAMAQALSQAFNNNQAAIPYFGDSDAELADPTIADFRELVRQLPNIRPEAVKSGGYASYKRANAKINDDLFDAAMAAVWGLVTRGAASVPTTILLGKTQREKLLPGHRH